MKLLYRELSNSYSLNFLGSQRWLTKISNSLKFLEIFHLWGKTIFFLQFCFLEILKIFTLPFLLRFVSSLNYSFGNPSLDWIIGEAKQYFISLKWIPWNYKTNKHKIRIKIYFHIFFLQFLIIFLYRNLLEQYLIILWNYMFCI